MIPARYAATRFPGKLMQILGDKSVIRHTYDATVATGLFDEVIVVTDSDIIYTEIENAGGYAVMSKYEHESGSDRIAEAAKEMEVDVIVNVQGDEPFVKKDPLEKLLAQFNDDSVQVASLMQEMKSQKEIVVVPQNIEEKNAETELTHEVLPKETKYGIAKQYGLTVAELEKQNPNISKKLLVGSQLKIRTSKLIEKEVAVENAIALEKEFVKEKFENKDPNIVRDASFADQLISKASEHIGTRYRSGGTTTDGFDCSGLMCYTFSSYDIKLPRSSIEMASYGSKIDAQSAQKGDLIFFKTRGSGRINHVGMVVEVLDGEIKFIHSATHGGVIISSTKESYYERNLAQINRVL